MKTNSSPAPAPRSLGMDKNLASIERIREAAADEYMAACRATRFGRNPAARAAGLARALELRPIVHPDYAAPADQA